MAEPEDPAGTRWPDDAALEAAGYAAGMDVWGVIRNCYGDILDGGDDLAEGQLQSLKRAILAEHAAELAAGQSSGRPEDPEPALGRHADGRGVITDLLGRIDGVTEIFTVAGAVRGNHVHKLTTQWTYVLSGRMVFAWRGDDGLHTATHLPGSLVEEPAGVPHAWKAITGCRVLVFTKGPRSGEAYETDTSRLAEEDWLLS